MKGVNVKLNYNQSTTECRDKLVDLCNKWGWTILIKIL